MNYSKLSSEEFKLSTKKPHYSKPVRSKILFYTIILIVFLIICIIISSVLVYYIKANKTKSATIASLSNELSELKIALRESKYEKEKMKGEIEELKKSNQLLKEKHTEPEVYKVPSLLSQDDMPFIESLFPGKRIRLFSLYQAKIEGDTEADFKKNLKDVPLLLFVVELNSGQKLGGYLSQICDNYFTSSGIISESDANAFLFSITNKKVYNVRSGSHAKHCRNDYLIAFNDDLMIHDRCLSTMSSSNFPNNYNTVNIDAKSYELTNGENFFHVKDMEVFKVIFK